MLFWKAEARHVRKIKQRRFGATHVNRKRGLLLLIYLDGTKFVLLKVFYLLGTIFLEFEQNHCPIMRKVNLRLTRVARKRLCLRSLTGLSRSHTRLKIFFSRKAFAKNHTLRSWCQISIVGLYCAIFCSYWLQSFLFMFVMAESIFLKTIF